MGVQYLYAGAVEAAKAEAHTIDIRPRSFDVRAGWPCMDYGKTRLARYHIQVQH